MTRRKPITYTAIDRIPKLGISKSQRRKLLEGKCRSVVTDILRATNTSLPKGRRDRFEYKLVQIVRATEAIYDV
jgi:hypothetical protein